MFALATIRIWRPWKLSNFQDPIPLVHLRPKFFHLLDLERPILNKPPTFLHPPQQTIEKQPHRAREHNEIKQK